MASSSEEYRRKAAEAEDIARKATDAYIRESYAEIARAYRGLADQVDRLKR
jgi:hypothetical protein